MSFTALVDELSNRTLAALEAAALAEATDAADRNAERDDPGPLDTTTPAASGGATPTPNAQ